MSESQQDLEWEEWDASTSPLSFGHHCLAGSFAGVVRDNLFHLLMRAACGLFTGDALLCG
jgi:hypothetical protein